MLDVINLTAQEMTLNYTANKNILIEAKESCRVPVPVVRCPLDKILADREIGQLNPYVEGQGKLVFIVNCFGKLWEADNSGSPGLFFKI